MVNQKKDWLEEKAILLYGQIYQYALAKVKEVEIAEEIAQTVMEVVIRKRNTLKHPEAFKRWVKVITTNKIRDHFRKLKRERESIFGKRTPQSGLPIFRMKKPIF